MPDLPLFFFSFTSSLKNNPSPFAVISTDTITLNLKGKTKEIIIQPLISLGGAVTGGEDLLNNNTTYGIKKFMENKVYE
jgi:hypothetical protein